MINIVVLQDTLSPLSASERVKVNQNWDAIRRGFSSLQNQIAFLSGGEDVDAILQRINDAITMAEQGTQTAIDNVNNNYAERVVEINQGLSDLTAALNNANNVTQATEAERLLTVQATNDARTAIDQLTSIVNDLRSLGEYNSSTTYKRNNLVSLDGRTYIALQDNTNEPVTNNSYWALFADRGQDGQRGPQGEAGASLNIIGVLPSTGDLPSSGNAGDAYTINGDLYVWSTESNDWVNVGQIKGEKGDRGEKGDSGYYTLANFQYTVPATSEGQTVIQIPLESFNDQDHSILLFINSVALRNDQYSISGRTITLNEAVVDYQNTTFYLNITQGVLVQPLDTINGSSIANGSISNAKLNNVLVNQINGYENRITTLENQTNTSTTNVAGLNREVAYLKLKQEASDRIEGGTVFADDFKGNRFGFTLDEVNSNGFKIRNGKMVMIRDEPINMNVIDATVVASAYSTAGNGGRKLVRLSNGWFVAGVKAAPNFIYFYVDKQDGNGFVPLCHMTSSTIGNGDIAMVSKGTDLYVLGSLTDVSVWFNKIDALIVTNTNVYGNRVLINNNGDTTIGNVSLAINPTNGHLHAAWASKNATLPNSFNIRYASSTDGGITWSTATQLSRANAVSQYFQNPSIVVRKDGKPLIIAEAKGLTNTVNITVLDFDGSAWTNSTNIYEGGIYVQSSPSVVLDKDGVIHVAWHGRDSTNTTTDYIRYSKSTDGGATWSAMQKLVVGQNASITTDRNGHIFIVYENAGSTYYINSINNGSTWSNAILISTGTNPSSLADNSLVYTIPPTVQMGSSNVKFNGNWTELQEQASMNATVIYTIPSTDYVGAFVKKIGIVEVSAYLNDVLMSSSLENGEYTFEKQNTTKELSVLRLELNRANTSGGNNDALTRILGGRS